MSHDCPHNSRISADKAIVSTDKEFKVQQYQMSPPRMFSANKVKNKCTSTRGRLKIERSLLERLKEHLPNIRHQNRFWGRFSFLKKDDEHVVF